jgi:hypothetical protein
MPISDEFAEQLIKELREENKFLLGLLLKKECLTIQDATASLIPEELMKIGKEPWNVQLQRLERSFRKPKLSELSGIPEQDEGELENVSEK